MLKCAGGTVLKHKRTNPSSRIRPSEARILAARFSASI
jgi:hypothetical protein